MALDLPTIAAQDAPSGTLDNDRLLLSFDTDGNVEKHTVLELLDHIQTNGLNAFKVADDITDRNAIPSDSRTEGMRVFVLSNGVEYSLSGGILNANWTSAHVVQVKATIAALTSLNGADITNGTTFYVRGYYATGDGGEGHFYYSSSSSATAYAGCVISPGDSTGRFFRIVPNAVNPRMCGAKGDFLTGGVGGSSSGTDDTAAFQAMFAYARVYGKPIGGYAGNYRLTDTIAIPTDFASPVDFGVRSGGATKGCFLYMDASAKALFELTKPSGQTWLNVVCYWKPLSGWNVAENSKEPQTDPLSYMFYIKGWGKYLTIQRCDAWHCAGLISSVQISAGSGTDQAALFDNTVSDCIMYYGYRGLNLNYGSGSRWARLRFQTSPGNANGEAGDPPSYTAEHAIYVGASGGPGLNNELFQNLNFEWSAFSKPMIYLVNSEIKFDSIHIEGIHVPYNASYGSVRSLIYQSGGNLMWEMIRIQNIHVAWGLLRTFYLFEFSGSPNTYFRLNNAIFDSFNDNPDDNVGGNTGGYYKLHRYKSDGGGEFRSQVDLVNDAAIRWESDSPSWWGHDDRQLPPQKRFETRTDFADGLNPWSPYYSGSPSTISYASEAGTNGVAVLNSGTANTNGTLLILPYAPIYRTKGVYRFYFRFKLSALATSGADEYAVRIGFFTDRSAAISTTPVDGIFFETQYSANTDDRFELVVKKNGGTTTRAQWIRSNDASTNVSTALLDTEANQWYDGVIVINSDGTQIRIFNHPYKSSTWANITTAGSLPDAATPLYPQAMITKVGAGSNVALSLDYLYVTFAPNGVA